MHIKNIGIIFLVLYSINMTTSNNPINLQDRRIFELPRVQISEDIVQHFPNRDICIAMVEMEARNNFLRNIHVTNLTSQERTQLQQEIYQADMRTIQLLQTFEQAYVRDEQRGKHHSEDEIQKYQKFKNVRQTLEQVQYAVENINIVIANMECISNELQELYRNFSDKVALATSVMNYTGFGNKDILLNNLKEVLRIINDRKHKLASHEIIQVKNFKNEIVDLIKNTQERATAVAQDTSEDTSKMVQALQEQKEFFEYCDSILDKHLFMIEVIKNRQNIMHRLV